MYKEKTKEEHCKTCKQVTKQPEFTFYCDNCEKEMDDGSLDLTVFKKKYNTENKRYELCSWKCVFEVLKKVKCNYFISLPLLTYDKDKPLEQSAEAFFKFIKK